MFEDTRWAARYQFLEELWRGRSRVICDRALEATLRDGGPGVAHGSHPPLAELVDDLVPRQPEAQRAWMVVATTDAARELERLREGTRFVPASRLPTLLRTETWDVAVVDLGAFLEPVDAPADEPGTRRRDRFGRFVPAGTPPPVHEGQLDDVGEDLVDAAAAAGRDRACTVVLSFPVRDYPARPHGFTLDEVSQLVVERFSEGRIYGVFSPPMAAIVSFGAVGATAEDEWSDEDDLDGGELDEEGEGEGDEDEDEVELAYDNTLGTQSPLLLSFLVVIGSDVGLADGLTLVELAPGSAQPTTARGGDGEMRAQVVEARRQADLAEIERQRLVARVDELGAQRELLEDEVSDLRDRLARAAVRGDDFVPVVSAAPPAVVESSPPTDDRLDLVLAREQAVRWQLTQTQRELDAARKRPVDALEAELASLRAQLEPGPRTADAEPPVAAPSGRAPAARPDGGTDPANPTRARAREEAARVIERLVRRVEREGIGALELRRELVAIRRLLRT